jgi:hypothetical protein
MTCEVAVMNKRGIALAADSAVTLGAGQKIYHSAEKLFQLTPTIPIGVMTYGNADLMGIPWEIVVKSYSRQCDDRKFDRVEQYAQDFLRFIEVNNVFFPETLQEREFRGTVATYWHGEFVKPLEQVDTADRPTKLAALLKNDFDYWKQYEQIEGLGTGYGDRIIADYGKILDELETELFSENDQLGPIQFSARMKQDIRTITRSMFTQQWFHPADLSGLVFAGMGEAEFFPVCLEYHVGTIAAGKLRFTKRSEVYVSHEMSACVAPFGQVDTINMFYRGVDRELLEKLTEVANSYIPRTAKKGDQETVLEKLREALEQEIDQQYRQPLMAAVDALPRQDLATMAEALVSLTALKARMSASEAETVAGPIDVAVLSKGEGFEWVERKKGIKGRRTVTEFVMP